MLTLEQARALRDGITPGPWQVNGAGVISDAIGHDIGDIWLEQDARLASSAPDLLDLIEAQAAEIAALAAQVEALRGALQEIADPTRLSGVVAGVLRDLARAALAATEPRHG